MRVCFVRVLAVNLALFACVCAGAAEDEAAGSGALWEARTMAAQARQQLQAAADAGRAGDAEAYNTHEAKANEMFAEARRLFEEAGGLNIEDTEALADYARVLLAQYDADLAADALRKATRLAPENAEAWLALGRGLLSPLYRRPEEAKDALARAAALSGGGPVEGAARAVLGRYYWDKKLFDFAEEQWTLALKAAPGEALAQAGLAAVLARRGAVREASQRIAALAQAPPDVLAAVVQMLGEALEDFEQSGLWFEDTADAHFAYASLLFRAGKYGESVAPLERTVRLDPKNHVAWNMLGSISMQLGRTARAREAFETSLKLNPEQERTREALRSLTTGAEGADREP
ncbi:MAG TPA: tetratricopeptide repeat protein [Candidatus Hydrogenedentes bacterium]|jgi:Flp pilus assembly protein TadD|nr:tetratricopeptide repeat protein [FCB group bacterium]HNV22080.1 tetratricopeptide repeat protein [Candidatus Hydrogenedentota bacterium]HNZ17958.1 tetratricopeptide repeat protein [Candidatus Hydrogenedentota bacterium]HOH34599.1 tetratricopeptide repeat protein [Candidatus Hydrogenedentota bacterium]HPA04492.1 tetratricopeptide repeat protein [Candidatus Hydrogenedentota bacterium]